MQYIFTVLLVERMPGSNDLKAGEGSVDQCFRESVPKVQTTSEELVVLFV